MLNTNRHYWSHTSLDISMSSGTSVFGLINERMRIIYKRTVYKKITLMSNIRVNLKINFRSRYLSKLCVLTSLGIRIEVIISILSSKNKWIHHQHDTPLISFWSKLRMFSTPVCPKRSVPTEAKQCNCQVIVRTSGLPPNSSIIVFRSNCRRIQTR